MKQFLRFLVSVTLVILAIFLLDFQVMVRTVKEGSATTFVAAIILNIVTVLVLGMRWHKLVVSRIRWTFMAHLALYYKATFLNTFTPANLGGDAYRLAKLRSHEALSGEIVKLLLRERLLGFYGYVIIFIIAYAFVLSSVDIDMQLIGNPYSYGVAISAIVLVLPLVGGQLVGRMVWVLRDVVGFKLLPKLESWLGTAVNLLSPKGTLQMMALTFLAILLWVASIKVVALGFGLSVPFAHLAAVATLVELVRLVPITIQGVGLREGVFSYLLGFLGYSYEQSYIVATLAYMALSMSIILCGPIGYLIDPEKQKNGQ